MYFIGFIFIYSLMMYGLTNLLVYGSGPYNILGKMREFCLKRFKVVGEMLECMMCTSTNVGWMFSLFNLIFLSNLQLTPFSLFCPNDTEYWLLIIILDAFFTSGVVWLIHTCQETLETITNYLNNKNYLEENNNNE